MSEPDAPLHGVTVLDLSTVGPGRRCAALLADLGARVIRVAPPATAGRIVPHVHAYSAGRGTETVTIDLRSDDGRAAFLELARDADVILDAFRPGVADRLGVGAGDVHAVAPQVVYASLTGYGRTGPMASWAGHDLNYQAVGGALAAQGRRADGGPALPGATWADSAGGGMHAALAICAALVRRASTGRGADLDVSATDGVLAATSLVIDDHLATGAPQGPGEGLLTGRYACHEVYRCADDRWVAVAAIERRFWTNLCTALGHPEHAEAQLDDDRQDDIRRDLVATFAMRDRDDWVARLGPADTCVSPVLDIDEIATSTYVTGRGLLGEVVGPDGTRFAQLGPVVAGAPAPDGPVRLDRGQREVAV
ncbi:CaiB/BaiF CoA transferase family protein [Nitriliruptor alkaliphilus]|uniref:CaiB/BaiF CoA transferase family protein n=1 Tax=Nitriliruptor alkaliphilus TaxID=427918 RepID=UPI000697B44F|nr:CaiB/BaiF CoA-transferase family protein [Nitriliruptor alkaliphilus]